jgi:hypothetical protein
MIKEININIPIQRSREIMNCGFISDLKLNL